MSPKFKSDQSNNGIKPKIANYIRLHPGTSFKSIQTIFDLSDSTLRYNLKYLERKGQIKSDIHRRIYYPIERERESNLSGTQQKLIYNIICYPGITQKDLAIKTKINRLTIRKNIKSLIEKQVIYINKIGKEIHHFYLNPEEFEKQEMLKVITKFLLRQIDEETYWDLREKYLKEKRNL